MANRRPPSKFGTNSLSVKLSVLISAVCLIAGVFAAVLMLKSEEKQFIHEEYEELKRLSDKALSRFEHYLQNKINLAEQANTVVTKQLFFSNTSQPTNQVSPIIKNDDGFMSKADNDLSAAVFKGSDLNTDERRLFSDTEYLWNIMAPPLLQDFIHFYMVTKSNFVRTAPNDLIVNGKLNASILKSYDQLYLKGKLNPTREAVLTDIHYIESLTKWAVSILVPIYNKDSYIGFTGTDIELNSLLSNFSQPDEYQGYVIFNKKGDIISTVSQRGDFVYLSSNLKPKYNTLPAIQKIINSALISKQVDFQSEFEMNNSAYLINIKEIDTLPWFIGIYKKQDKALHILKELKVKFFGLFILYALFVALLLHQVLFQLVLSRINSLVSAVIGFGKGQWDMPSMPSSDDEIGLLNDSFNDMSFEIKKLVNGLNQRINEKEIAEKAANRLSKAVAFSGTAVVISNEHFQIEYINPKMEQMTGFHDSHFIHSPLLSIISKEMAILVEDIDIDLRSRNYWRGDTMLESKTEEPIWVSLSISPIREENGKISSYVASAQDISFVKESQRKMEELAYFDTLTGLANRTFFRMQLRKSMALAGRGHYAFALFYFDLDEFKRINDTLGHDAGDRLLVEVAERLKLRLRAEDTIARLGGDEFALLLSGIDKREKAMEVANIIQQTLNKPIKLGNNEVIVSASIGITMAPNDSKEEEQLLKHADLAMYEAKAKGRNTYHFYTQELDAAANERLYIENELRHALKEHQFSLVYQPQVNCFTYETTGYEALIRWHHPTKGTIPPTKFIPIAEATGLIVELGAWVLEEACRFSVNLQSKGLVGKMSINLSARQFKDAQIIETLSLILQQTNMPSELLHLELTESMLMGDVKGAILQLHQMKDLGIGLSIDDFGTGYSSLSYLKRFPVDVLKVDRSFVKDIPEDSNDMEITAAIIAMAQKLNLSVVAEGVETVEQIEFLKRNNCHIVQGYYFSPPLHENDVEGFQATSKECG